jgi:hypothetical protein
MNTKSDAGSSHSTSDRSVSSVIPRLKLTRETLAVLRVRSSLRAGDSSCKASVVGDVSEEPPPPPAQPKDVL